MSSVVKVRLGDYVTQIRGVSYKPKDISNTQTEKHTPILRAHNIQDEGLNFEELVYVDKTKINEQQYIRKGDILICASSGSKSLVGKAAQATQDLNLSFGAFCKVIRPRNIHASYLGYYFKSKKYRRIISDLSAGANINNLRADHIDNLEIVLPPKDIQEQIAITLDTTSELLALRKQQLAELDNLVKSIFYDMFGDPGENPYNWNTVLLGNVADIVSGITKGRKTAEANLVEVPYLRVANVQDGHLNLSEIKLIEATDSEIKKYQLYNGDLLMTEGGDPDKLGRCAIWRGEIPISIHQNHIFRVRLIGEVVLPEYASFLIGSSYGKRYFLKAAKQTTGIATINSTQLKNFPMLVPNIDIQYKLKNIVTKMDEQKFLVQKAIDETQHLFDSLMSEYFD